MSSKFLENGIQISGKSTVAPVDAYTYYYIDFRSLKNKTLIIKNLLATSIKYIIDASVEDCTTDNTTDIANFGYDEAIKAETTLSGTTVYANTSLNDIHTYWRIGVKAATAGETCSCEIKYTAIN